MITNYRGLGLILAIVAMIGLAPTSAQAAGPASNGSTTCSGGSIAAGVYSNLYVSGVCNVDAGSVSVQNDVMVLAGGALVVAYGGTDKKPIGSNLSVGGNIYVHPDGVLVLGCEPVNYICVNDPDQTVGTYFTKVRVGGDLIADGALAVVVHLSIIGHNISMVGGGGGVTCAGSVPALGGSPPYGDFEDVLVGGALAVNTWQSCWFGIFRTTVAGSVVFNNNVSADPDGNEFGTNSILGNFTCAGNNPVPQLGDSEGSLTNVFGRAFGQCANPQLVR